jgi:hypothetical protein
LIVAQFDSVEKPQVLKFEEKGPTLRWHRRTLAGAIPNSEKFGHGLRDTAATGVAEPAGGLQSGKDPSAKARAPHSSLLSPSRTLAAKRTPRWPSFPAEIFCRA